MPNYSYGQVAQALITGLLALLGTLGAIYLKEWLAERADRAQEAKAETRAEEDLRLQSLWLLTEYNSFAHDVSRVCLKIQRTIDLWRTGDHAQVGHFLEDLGVEVAALNVGHKLDALSVAPTLNVPPREKQLAKGDEG